MSFFAIAQPRPGHGLVNPHYSKAGETLLHCFELLFTATIGLFALKPRSTGSRHEFIRPRVMVLLWSVAKPLPGLWCRLFSES